MGCYDSRETWCQLWMGGYARTCVDCGGEITLRSACKKHVWKFPLKAQPKQHLNWLKPVKFTLSYWETRLCFTSSAKRIGSYSQGSLGTKWTGWFKNLSKAGLSQNYGCGFGFCGRGQAAGQRVLFWSFCSVQHLSQAALLRYAVLHIREFSQIGNVDTGMNVDIESHPVGSSTPQNF